MPEEGGRGRRPLTRAPALWVFTRCLKPSFVLTAKKLSLYQVLAPNAFAPIEEFVPILQKTVSSTIHEVTQIRFSPSSAGERLCGISLRKCSEIGVKAEPEVQGLRAQRGPALLPSEKETWEVGTREGIGYHSHLHREGSSSPLRTHSLCVSSLHLVQTPAIAPIMCQPVYL